MLTAANTDAEYVTARAANRDTTYFCPACLDLVTLRRGRVVTPHFAHRAASDCPAGVGESADHLMMKDSLLRWFPQARAEVPLVPGRRADVVVPVEDRQLVIECQASAISVKDWAARTRDYTRAGIPVLWLWHRRRLSETDHPYERRVPDVMREHADAAGDLWIWRPTPSGLGAVFATVALSANIRRNAGFPDRRPSTHRVMVPRRPVLAAGGTQYRNKLPVGYVRADSSTAYGLLLGCYACEDGCGDGRPGVHQVCNGELSQALQLNPDATHEPACMSSPQILGLADVDDDPLATGFHQPEELWPAEGEPVHPLIEQFGVEDWSDGDAYHPSWNGDIRASARRFLADF